MSQSPYSPRSLSIAIPVYNEQEVLPELFRRVVAVIDSLPELVAEIVFVNDGSSDDTWETLRAFQAVDERVTVVSLSRNFGHQAAITAALDHVRGDVVVVMDADLQDIPEAIPRLLERHRAGFDVVYAVRAKRKEHPVMRACYSLFYRVSRFLADIDVPLDAGDFALLSRRVVDRIRQSPERHRYLRGLRAWCGFRQTGVVVERAERQAGQTKYSLRKLFKLAADGIFSFSVWPLRAATLLGGTILAAVVLFAMYALFDKLCTGRPPAGFTSLILAVTFLTGVQLLFLGVIGEYIGRIYEEVKQRPHYLVADCLSGELLSPQRDPWHGPALAAPSIDTVSEVSAYG